MIFDSKEPVEFWLPQSTTVQPLYNTKAISKQINEIYDVLGRKYRIELIYMIYISSNGTITTEDHKRPVKWMQTSMLFFQEKRGIFSSSLWKVAA